MTNEAERLAVELTKDIEGFPEPTQLERKAAALLRKLAAEVEALRVDAGRYRFVRDNGIVRVQVDVDFMNAWGEYSHEALDDVLNTAMEEELK